jgi:hypothetical protein
MVMFNNLFSNNVEGKGNWAKNSQGRFESLYFRWESLDWAKKLEKLEKFYNNNALYMEEEFSAYINDDWLEAIKPLRNPTNRSVNFFASKLCQGTPKITVANGSTQVQQSIQAFLKSSNFDLEKRGMLRRMALQGNLFTKVNFDGSLYESMIDSRYVTWFTEDSHGNITEIRIDIPIADNKTYTEYWIGGVNGYTASWTHRMGNQTPLDRLGDAQSSTFLSAFGIDFVPIVHSRFRDTGELWGRSCIDHAIVKIVDIDRKHTRLSSLIYQFHKPIWAVVSMGRDANGRPYPVKRITRANVDQNKSDDNLFIYLEGSDIKDMTWKPTAEVLDALKNDEEDLQMDLPELRYYALTDSQLSGKALSMILAGALDRAKEAQENFNSGQEKLNEMALTMGRFFGLFSASIGSYENGDFNHNISFDEIIPTNSQADKATTMAQLSSAVLTPEKMLLAGYSQDEIDRAFPNQG